MHFSVVGHLDCFHVMDIMNEAALYEHSCISLVVDIVFHFSWANIQE